MSNKWIRYLALMVMPAFALVCIIVFNLLTLEAVGEYSNIDRIVLEQRETGGLYMGFVHSVGAYKDSGYRQTKPEIVVIGSSRSLQVRDYFFNATFFNAGGEVRSPTDAFSAKDRLFSLHKPKHLVWFMDFFQFCSSSNIFRENLRRPRTSVRQAGQEVQRGLVPFRLITTKKVVGFRDFMNWGTGGAERHRQGVRILGLGVQKDLGAAFGPDGSLYNYLDGAPLPESERHDVGLAAIEQGSSIWKHDCHLNLEAMRLVDMFVGEIRSAGVKLTLIAAPLPDYMLEAMQVSGRYAYVNQWLELMKKRYAEFFDYTSVMSIDAQDCEFLDYYHGGEVTYIRILADLGRRGNSALGMLLDTERLNSILKRKAGRLVAADNLIGRRLLGNGPPTHRCPYAPL